MTALAAQRVGLSDRGLLRSGMAADITVFDPATVADKATFEQPHQPSVGFAYVFVNGQKVLDHGKLTAARPGRGLRGPGLRGAGAARQAVTLGRLVLAWVPVAVLVRRGDARDPSARGRGREARRPVARGWPWRTPSSSGGSSRPDCSLCSPRLWFDSLGAVAGGCYSYSSERSRPSRCGCRPLRVAAPAAWLEPVAISPVTSAPAPFSPGDSIGYLR